MSKKKLRNNGYYLNRLRKEHPAIYDDLEAGRIPSVRQALLLAGLKRPPSPVNGLKREWLKASPSEQRKFLLWVRHERGLPSKGAPAKALTGPDGHLLPDVVDGIQRIMTIRKLTLGDAKVEMGLNRYDYRMSEALQRKVPPKPDVVHALEPWLRRNAAYLY